MRLWVHLIWRQANGSVLMTSGPRENTKLEELINLCGEQYLAYAWYLYVNSEPRAYNLEPLKHVDKFQSKNGKTYMNTLVDTASITRFPLSAFLAVYEGYFVEAKIRCEDRKNASYLNEKLECSRALKDVIPGLKQAWALPEDEVETEA